MSVYDTIYITPNDKMISKESIKKGCSGLWLHILKLQRCLNGDNEEWHNIKHT
jgi:hypothetical protein